MVAPVVEMSRLEDQLAALDAEFPPPPEGPELAADRLGDFLAIRRELLPRYRRWDEVVREVEARGESWAGARDVLAETRDVMRTQIEALRARAMSPAEFRALESLVYDTWLDAVDDRHAVTGGNTQLLELTRSDLELVRELVRRDGASPALADLEDRFTSRLREMTSQLPPVVEGVPPEVAGLLWAHHDEIAALRLGSHPMHSALQTSGRGGVGIRVGSDGTSITTDAAAEPTPVDR